MIISRTPFRISLFGGGTDYPAWYRERGGAVLAASINKYCYLTCRYLPPFFEHRLRVVYSKVELCQEADEIAHPAVREGLRLLGIRRGVEIHHDGDLPARSGMGSSSAFTVGLLHALHALGGHMPSKRQLAQESIHLEQEVMRETVGSQDQVLAAYGGLNHVVFQPSGDFEVRPVTLPAERVKQLSARLLLFYTGIRRTASDVARTYVDDIDSREQSLRRMIEFVNQALSILCDGDDLDALGHLLHEAWEVKRSLSASVSNPQVDALYTRARSAGALGGKLTGAGGGGFLLLFAPPDRQAKLRAELSDLLHVPVDFEHSGSQIIFYEPEQDYAAEERERARQTLSAFRELGGEAT